MLPRSVHPPPCSLAHKLEELEHKVEGLDDVAKSVLQQSAGGWLGVLQADDERVEAEEDEREGMLLEAVGEEVGEEGGAAAEGRERGGAAAANGGGGGSGEGS